MTLWVLLAVSLAGGLDTVPVPIGSKQACPACRISVSPVATLRNPGDSFPVDPGPDQAIARDTRGWFYLVSPARPDQVVVFDPRGVAVRTLGRSGDGPGEFRSAAHLATGPGDTLFVWDRSARRISVFTPAPGSTLVRTLPFPHSMAEGGFLVEPGGGFIANADVGHAAHFGRFIHRYSGRGRHLASWGRDEVVIRSDLQARVRSLARARVGLWTLRSNSYRMELWDFSGALRRDLRRLDPALPDYRHNEIRPDRALDPVYLGMQERDDGLLTVLVLVPDRRWKEVTQFRRGPHGMDFKWLDLDRAFDTQIEVIDPENARLLKMQRFDQVFTQFIGPSLVAAISARPDSASTLSVWRITFNHSAHRPGGTK